jgi:hypothetical protein
MDTKQLKKAWLAEFKRLGFSTDSKFSLAWVKRDLMVAARIERARFLDGCWLDVSIGDAGEVPRSFDQFHSLPLRTRLESLFPDSRDEILDALGHGCQSAVHGAITFVGKTIIPVLAELAMADRLIAHMQTLGAFNGYLDNEWFSKLQHAPGTL